jgi:hypothetical protein
MMDEQQGDMPELLEVLDVDALPEAFVSREKVSIKVAGRLRVVDVSTDGMDEVSRRWRRKNPRPLPPYTEKQVPEGSPLAAKLGHTKGLAIVKVYDEKDPAFEQQVEDWSICHNFVVVAHCLKIRLRKGGEDLEDLDERAKALQQMGMTSAMATQLVGTLTQMAVAEISEAVRFFGRGSDSGG